MDKKDGGPAFPVLDVGYWGARSAGMTLRDWFAGQALIGILSINGTIKHQPNKTPELCCPLAYEYADAMLKAREDKS